MKIEGSKKLSYSPKFSQFFKTVSYDPTFLQFFITIHEYKMRWTEREIPSLLF